MHLRGVEYTYTYDNVGNILTISVNGVEKNSYEYDGINQLTRENNVNANTTTLYLYDKSGNITAKSSLAYTTAARSTLIFANGYIKGYTYGNTSWGDLLTKYNGTDITYDAIGNPLKWRNATSITWEGRSLSRMTVVDGGASSDLNFKYNRDGIRTFKSNYNNNSMNMHEVDYVVDGSKIISETHSNNGSGSNNRRYYYYDESGAILGFEYNGTKYSFRSNIQGDITGIFNFDGVLVAEYSYDAWGKILSITDGSGNNVSTNAAHVANANPFRYRGYYYDIETGLYYVSSRYYDPEVCRFINADDSDTLKATPTALTDKNLFAYCDNNPVMRVDHGGEFWDIIFDVVSLVTSIAEVIVNPTSAAAWAGLAADVVCTVVPGLTGGSAIVKAVTKVDDVVDTAKTIYRAADKASDIRKATGSYEILYKSGKNYVGKGGFKRAIDSATRYEDVATSIMWKSAPNKKEAFIDEFLMQKSRGVSSSNCNANTYNKIWSPGRNYYYQRYGRY